MIDYEELRELLSFQGMKDLADAYRSWVEESIGRGDQHQDRKWTESVAVGSEGFVTAMKKDLAIKVKAREVIGVDGSYEL